MLVLMPHGRNAHLGQRFADLHQPPATPTRFRRSLHNVMPFADCEPAACRRLRRVVRPHPDSVVGLFFGPPKNVALAFPVAITNRIIDPSMREQGEIVGYEDRPPVVGLIACQLVASQRTCWPHRPITPRFPARKYKISRRPHGPRRVVVRGAGIPGVRLLYCEAARDPCAAICTPCPNRFLRNRGRAVWSRLTRARDHADQRYGSDVHCFWHSQCWPTLRPARALSRSIHSSFVRCTKSRQFSDRVELTDSPFSHLTTM